MGAISLLALLRRTPIFLRQKQFYGHERMRQLAVGLFLCSAPRWPDKRPSLTFAGIRDGSSLTPWRLPTPPRIVGHSDNAPNSVRGSETDPSNYWRGRGFAPENSER